jgi:hypothetical protein
MIPYRTRRLSTRRWLGLIEALIDALEENPGVVVDETSSAIDVFGHVRDLLN